MKSIVNIGQEKNLGNISKSHKWIALTFANKIYYLLSVRKKTKNIDTYNKRKLVPWSGSGIRCLLTPGPGSGIRNRFDFRIPDLGSQPHIFLKVSDKFLGEKFYNSLKTGPNFFLRHLKNKIIFNFVKFVATKKRFDNKFFSPLSFVAAFKSGIRDTGSGMGKNQDPR